MPPCRLPVASLLVLAAFLAGPVRAQEEPAVEAPPAAEAPHKAAPKPVRRPAPKPAPAPKAEAAPPVVATPTGAWPNGASAVSEVYGDWTISCTRENEKRQCQLSQAQGVAQTGQRRFSIELNPPQDGRSNGLLLMPLGLSIEPGVTFKLDDATLGKGAPYTSCVQAGCIVPISFPTVATDAMKTAVNLRITGTKPNGEADTITVPLAGFAAALSRMAQLLS
ncbi:MULTISPECIES: invasion associated locus B family protein [Methylobacterium]|jgi:invasion protein IalB|uniref:invasion associated locus B family protein n=3 Tax=Methylobacteriaceae TaxID=119045 RepID=UPI0008F1799C|nr:MULTISPECIES: invasion associated locus B family protein [Methylobacterium]MBK3395758.1 invasion associated locus B family protein [Methylobacterium ajmalii]MBK3410249.1 invasion associated locus B family protein [Methylobacterium ajmalii]MBZ6412161.1 invasion associated locus B family protein [Methylobacterium sp.]SFF10237.1 Invasion protein IalB, involved in pathogenesis [Methylobacterium sp. yr596]